jgi:NTE family protein
MLDLTDIAFFSNLPPEGLEAVRQAVDLRSYPSGSLVCSRGDEGRAFYAVAYGGVSVLLGEGGGRGGANVFLGPGQGFGEMSLLSGMPVSASVMAAQDTVLYVLPKSSFLELFEAQPALHQALFQMLISRIRHRTGSPTLGHKPACALVVLSSGSDATRRFQEAFFEAVDHYAPGSFFLGKERIASGNTPAAPDRPDFFPPSSEVITRVPNSGGYRQFAVPESTNWYVDLLKNWRSSGGVGRVLVLTIGSEEIYRFRELLEKGDAVLVQEEDDADSRLAALSVGSGLADFSFFRIGRRQALNGSRREGGWSFHVPADEIERLAGTASGLRWSQVDAPNVDWIARWITRREIGIALSAGAAWGFAHLGVLEVLEEAGINVDFLVGASMGGAVALHYAKSASARESIEQSRALVASNSKVMDVTWFPRSSLLAGKKHHRAAVGLYGAKHIAELEKPAAAITADLVRGEPFVFEEGSAAVAARATTAIPGIFPPVSHKGRLLVDGALVSRVPVGLLFRRRCGLKLAVNVVPASEQRTSDLSVSHGQMKERFESLLGLRYVIANSWQLLGASQSALETQEADILVEPRTERFTAYNFGSFDRTIEAGRTAAREKIDTILESVAALRKPGAP